LSGFRVFGRNLGEGSRLRRWSKSALRAHIQFPFLVCVEILSQRVLACMEEIDMELLIKLMNFLEKEKAFWKSKLLL